MHTVRTKSLHTYAHPEIEIIVNLKKVPKHYLVDFINHLQTLVADGAKFTPGTLIQYGTYALQVTESDHDYIRLDEPNNKGLPITFKPGVTNTLETALSQLTFLEGYGIDKENHTACTILQSAFVCKSYLNSKNLALSRLEAVDKEDSGWFVGCMNTTCRHDESENLSRTSLYEVLCQHPQLRPWLGFPINSLIVLQDDNIEVSINDILHEVQADSTLAQSLKV